MPRLLDLFCCAGGAARGYIAAGFDVVGVDIVDSPRYPGTFVKADAVEYLAAHGHEFDAIHASPPCQHASQATKQSKAVHLNLIPPTRDLLLSRFNDKPWVIENVVGAELRNPTLLCGSMFRLRSYRHRLFESNIRIDAPPHPEHTAYVHYPHDKRKTARFGTPFLSTDFIPVHGSNNAPYELQCEALGIPVGTMLRREVVQAIPPAFAEYIGYKFLRMLPR